jgi:hypothetical protein
LRDPALSHLTTGNITREMLYFYHHLQEEDNYVDCGGPVRLSVLSMILQREMAVRRQLY